MPKFKLLTRPIHLTKAEIRALKAGKDIGHGVGSANPKALKGEKQGYITFILHLAPAKLSGKQVCANASPECIKLCLNTAGHGGIGLDMYGTNSVQEARLRKTKLFFSDRALFLKWLHEDIRAAIAYAESLGLIPVFRLNGTSDIRWELYGVIQAYPAVQFYDYTKLTNRKNLPSNYHLTFSLSETNEPQAFAALANGLNVAVIFRHKPTPATPYPARFMGRPVISGDDSDLRFLDPAGSIVALYAKGRAKHATGGMVQENLRVAA